MRFDKFKIYCLAALLWAAPSWAGQFSAEVNPPRVQYGDTVRLEVSYEGTDAGMIQPNFDALNDDFAIYSTSTTMQSQFVNGVGQQKRVWTLMLMPQKEGKLQIPAITAGNYKTVPLNIEVLPSGSTSVQSAPRVAANKATTSADDNTAAPANNADFWIEMTVDEKTPYVGQEINGTLVIYDNKDIQFTQDPTFESSDEWEIRQLGEPDITTKNGQRIIKLKYAFFPQKSGKLTLPSVAVRGYYVERKQGDISRSVNGLLQLFEINFDVTDLMGVQKPVMLKTKPIAVEVKPIPADYGNAWWLPATELALRARWADERPVFKVGEAVTREITLMAAGVSENQLPVLEFAPNAAWKQYPESPLLSSEVANGRVYAKAVTRVVYIPQQGGEQILPEIKVRWYNTKTHHIEKAVIPAEKMYVGGAAGAAQPAPTPAAVNTPDTTVESMKNTAEKPAEKPIPRSDIWLIAAVIIGAFLCGIVFNYMILRKKIMNPTEQNSGNTVSDIEKNLRRADYRALRDSLLRWGEQTYGDTYINNLNDLSARIKEPEFERQMQLLNQNLYAGGTEKLDAKIILQYVKNRQKAKAEAKQPPLPDLYK